MQAGRKELDNPSSTGTTEATRFLPVFVGGRAGFAGGMCHKYADSSPASVRILTPWPPGLQNRRGWLRVKFSGRTMGLQNRGLLWGAFLGSYFFFFKRCPSVLCKTEARQTESRQKKPESRNLSQDKRKTEDRQKTDRRKQKNQDRSRTKQPETREKYDSPETQKGDFSGISEGFALFSPKTTFFKKYFLSSFFFFFIFFLLFSFFLSSLSFLSLSLAASRAPKTPKTTLKNKPLQANDALLDKASAQWGQGFEAVSQMLHFWTTITLEP